MAEKKSGAMKWLLIGCGCILGVGLVGAASCAGLIYLGVQKANEEADKIAAVGETYLKNQGDVADLVGNITGLERKPILEGGYQIHVVNDGGTAIIRYRLTGSKASGDAVVYFTRSGGTWRAVGSEVTADGKSVKTGETVEVKSTPGSGFDD